MQFFNVNNIALEIIGYPISYIELIGTLFGLISVFYASRAKIITWPSGIINELFLFILFFQIQLYADMFLQVYFFIVTIYGWYKWNSNTIENKISKTSPKYIILMSATTFIASILFGILFANIHKIIPHLFPVKAAYPYTDSFVMVLSIIATFLLAKKKIENWYFWILVDFICVILYYRKQVYFLSLEYLIFLGLASYGLFNWKKKLING